MVCLIVSAVLFLFCNGVEGATPRSAFFDSKLIETTHTEMHKECGAPCVKRFEDMPAWLEENAAAVFSGQVNGPFNLMKREGAPESHLAWVALANHEFGKALELSRALNLANTTVLLIRRA